MQSLNFYDVLVTLFLVICTSVCIILQEALDNYLEYYIKTNMFADFYICIKQKKKTYKTIYITLSLRQQYTVKRQHCFVKVKVCV